MKNADRKYSTLLSLTAALLSTLVAGQRAHAAIQSASKLGSTKEALGLPLENRIETIRGQGPDGYRSLVQIMFNEKLGMETRWRAVTAAGRIGGAESRPELERALKSTDWYMRNAGLIALRSIDRAAAAAWAKKLLSDKALVVRAEAVEELVVLKETGSAKLLWEKLYAPENFKHSQSLYIRKHIVEALAQLETAGHEAKFVEVLNDKDASLHAPAIAALEKLTSQTLGSANDPLRMRRDRWLSWWKEKAQTAL